jgi:hypothetical protein
MTLDERREKSPAFLFLGADAFVSRGKTYDDMMRELRNELGHSGNDVSSRVACND